MTTMTLRGIDETTATALKEKARREATSVNTVTLRILREGLGLEKKKRRSAHTDLDHLAGTWTAEDAAEFTRNTAAFETIDEAMWK